MATMSSTESAQVTTASWLKNLAVELAEGTTLIEKWERCTSTVGIIGDQRPKKESPQIPPFSCEALGFDAPNSTAPTDRVNFEMWEPILSMAITSLASFFWAAQLQEDDQFDTLEPPYYQRQRAQAEWTINFVDEVEREEIEERRTEYSGGRSQILNASEYDCEQEWLTIAWLIDVECGREPAEARYQNLNEMDCLNWLA